MSKHQRSKEQEHMLSEPESSAAASNSQEEEENYELPPPDGGYGWVICFASFMCNLVVDGIAYTFGQFIGEYVNYFGESKAKVAFVGSLLSGVYLSVGPLVSALVNKFGCRAVCVFGSVLAATSFVLSVFSTNISMLMVTYGFLGGFGFGMIYLPAIVAVGYYFESKRALATGISVCGSGVGTFVFAPLATYMLNKYDWKNANVILAGIILNCAIFGALMRPLVHPKKDKHKSLMLRMYEEKKAIMQRGSFAKGSFFFVTLPDGTVEKRMKLPLNFDPGVHSSLALDLLAQPQPQVAGMSPVPTLPTILETNKDPSSVVSSPTRRIRTRNRVSESEVSEANPHKYFIPKNVSQPAFSTIPFRPSLATARTASRNEISEQDLDTFDSKSSSSSRPLSRKDIFYSGSIVRLSVLSMSQYEKENQGPSQTDADAGEGDDAFKSAVNTIMDFKLLTNPVFMLIALSNVFGMAALYVPFYYLADAAVTNGISKDSATLLLSIIGLTNTFCRILCGWISDLPQISSLLLNNICLIVACVAVVMIPFCLSYTSYIVVAVLFGVGISGYISLTSIILVELLGLDKLTNSFGLLILFRGFATLFGPPLAGALYEINKSYSLPFFIAGGLFGAAAVTSFLAPLGKRCQKQQATQAQLEILSPIGEDPFEQENEDEDDQPITLKTIVSSDLNAEAAEKPKNLMSNVAKVAPIDQQKVVIQNESVL